MTTLFQFQIAQVRIKKSNEIEGIEKINVAALTFSPIAQLNEVELLPAYKTVITIATVMILKILQSQMSPSRLTDEDTPH